MLMLGTPGRKRKNPPVYRRAVGDCEPVALQLQVRDECRVYQYKNPIFR